MRKTYLIEYIIATLKMAFVAVFLMLCTGNLIGSLSMFLFGVFKLIRGLLKNSKHYKTGYLNGLLTRLFSSLTVVTFVGFIYLSFFDGLFIKLNTQILYPIIVAATLNFTITYVLYTNQEFLTGNLRRKTRFLYCVLFVFSVVLCLFAIYLHYNTNAWGFWSVYKKDYVFTDIDDLLDVLPAQFKRGFFSLFNSFYYTLAYQTDYWTISRWLFKIFGFYLSEVIVALYGFLLAFFILVKPVDVIVHYVTGKGDFVEVKEDEDGNEIEFEGETKV